MVLKKRLDEAERAAGQLYKAPAAPTLDLSKLTPTEIERLRGIIRRTIRHNTSGKKPEDLLSEDDEKFLQECHEKTRAAE